MTIGSKTPTAPRANMPLTFDQSFVVWFDQRAFRRQRTAKTGRRRLSVAPHRSLSAAHADYFPVGRIDDPALIFALYLERPFHEDLVEGETINCQDGGGTWSASLHHERKGKVEARSESRNDRCAR